MRTIRFKLVFRFLICPLLMLAACSGGGDSGSAKTGRVSTGARILHGAIDAPPVQMKSSLVENQILTTTKFALEAPYVELPRGQQELDIEVGDGTAERFRFDPDVKKNEKRTYLIYGSREVFGVRIAEFLDVPPNVDSTSAAVRVLHALIGASQLNVTIGDTPLAPVGFSGGSEYVTVPAGVQNVSAVRSADQRTVLSGPKDLQPGKAYTLVITGEVGYLVLASQYEDN